MTEENQTPATLPDQVTPPDTPDTPAPDTSLDLKNEMEALKKERDTLKVENDAIKTAKQELEEAKSALLKQKEEAILRKEIDDLNREIATLGAKQLPANNPLSKQQSSVTPAMNTRRSSSIEEINKIEKLYL